MKTFVSLLMIVGGLAVFINVNNIERRLNKRYDRKLRANKNWWARKYFGKSFYFHQWWDIIGGIAAMLTVLGVLMLLDLY
jgi:hypothetical protein